MIGNHQWGKGDGHFVNITMATRSVSRCCVDRIGYIEEGTIPLRYLAAHHHVGIIYLVPN